MLGGAGGDLLTGGTGADRFVHGAIGDLSSVPVNADIIADFLPLLGDRISLAAIDADGLTPGDQAFVVTTDPLSVGPGKVFVAAAGRCPQNVTAISALPHAAERVAGAVCACLWRVPPAPWKFRPNRSGPGFAMNRFLRVSLLALVFGLPMVAIAPSDAEAARRSGGTTAQTAQRSGTHARSPTRQHRQTAQRPRRHRTNAAAQG